MTCHTGHKPSVQMPLPSGGKFTEYSWLKDTYEDRKERGDIHAQLVAGKCLEIVAGIINTLEVILLKNTIGRLSLPSEIFSGAGFQRVEFASIFVFV